MTDILRDFKIGGNRGEMVLKGVKSRDHLDAALAAPEVLAAPEGLAVPVLANKTCFCKFTILCKNENSCRDEPGAGGFHGAMTTEVQLESAAGHLVVGQLGPVSVEQFLQRFAKSHVLYQPQVDSKGPGFVTPQLT